MTRQRDEDLQREIQDHLAFEAAEREAGGLSRPEARLAAVRAFGNVTRTREEARAVWIADWLDQAAQDLRYALRLARRQPAFTCGAVLMLALGLSASTTIFGALHAVVLAPLPFDRPAELVRLWQTNPARQVSEFSVSLPTFRDWQQRSRSFTAMAAEKDGSVTVQGLGDPQQLPAQFITHNLLSLLGLRVALGRAFAATDDEAGGGLVVILSDGLWRRSFAADPAANGRTILIDGRLHRIIGVMPEMALSRAQLLLPLVPFDEDRRGLSDIDVFARLKPHVSINQASAEMTAVAGQLAREYPEDLAGWGVRLAPLAESILGPRIPRVLYLLLTAVGVLLLVACANLSGLLLVRASARTREMAIRAAVGGGRARIVRQLLTESLLLALIGGALGVGLAYGGTYVLRTRMAAVLPRADQITVDGWVLLFATAVTLATGVLAGLAPARQVARINVQHSLKESAASVMQGANRARNVLVVGQLALSIVLLAAAGLTLRTLDHLNGVDLGFTPHRIVTVQVAPRTDREAFFAALLDRLRLIPGVAHVGATSGAPMTSGNTSLNVYPVGDAVIPSTESVQSDWRSISAGYFDAMETPVMAGRDFTPRDTANAPKVVLVNQSLARMLWGDANPIGRRVDLGGGGGEPATIIGLVRDMRAHTPATPPAPTFYMSAYRGVWGPMTLVIRTASDADRLLPLIRAEVRALDPSLPVFETRTMDDLLRAQLAPQRLMTTLLTGFALLALLLAGIGVYGVMAFAVGQRTREAAIRLALGATRRDVIGPLVREGVILVAIGTAIGLGLAIPLTGLMRGVLSGISPADPISFAGATILLVTVALAACYIPAHRASRVNPVSALRLYPSAL